MRLALIKTGDAAAEVAAKHGDYDRMFLAQIEDLPVEVLTVHAHEDQPLPDLTEVDSVMITGSPASVTDREPWADRLSAWTAAAVEASTPVLGVCYGHQLLAHACGGAVEENDRGYEIGTIEVALTEEGKRDPLLGRLTAPMSFNSLHSDVVTRLPAGATVLAHTPICDVQAYRLRDRVWGVQFHPEITDAAMAMYVDARRPRIEADATRRGVNVEEEVERIRQSVAPTPAGPELLRAFVKIAMEPGG